MPFMCFAQSMFSLARFFTSAVILTFSSAMVFASSFFYSPSCRMYSLYVGTCSVLLLRLSNTTIDAKPEFSFDIVIILRVFRSGGSSFFCRDLLNEEDSRCSVSSPFFLEYTCDRCMTYLVGQPIRIRFVVDLRNRAYELSTLLHSYMWKGRTLLVS